MTPAMLGIIPNSHLSRKSPQTSHRAGARQVIIHLRNWATVFLLASASLAPGGPAQADEAPRNDKDGAARLPTPLDFATLKTLPLIETIERGTREYTLFLPDPDAFGARAPVAVPASGRARALARIEGLPPDLRRLVWLTWLLDCWGGKDTEGLHTFFYLWGGDDAFQVRDALFEAGLLSQDRVFRQAMAAFGPLYPADRKTRAPFFAWSQPATRIDATTTMPQPLNAFDEKLMALSVAFGSREAYVRAIEKFVAATPNLRDWVNAQRAKLSDETRLAWLTGQLSASPEAMAARIASWPAPYRQLYLIDLFNKEMLNGGVHQFFLNSSGALAPEVANALREAGLPKHAAAVEQGIAMFAAPYPADRKVRGRYFFVNGETTDWDKQLDALTAEVDDGAIGAAMLAIARREGVLPQ